MKKKILIVLLSVFQFFISAEIVVIDRLPKDIDNFISLRDKIARTPEGGAAIMIIALAVYSFNENSGSQFLTAAVSVDLLVSGECYNGYKINPIDMNRIKAQIEKQKNLPNSYISGVSSKNNFRIPKTKIKIELISTKFSGNKETGFYKLFIKSSLYDSPRAITLKVSEKGIWKAFEWNSLIE